MKNWYFKKTLFGMILMVKRKKPDITPGIWLYYWDKATEAESQEFSENVERLSIYKEIIDKVKDSNPEVLI